MSKTEIPNCGYRVAVMSESGIRLACDVCDNAGSRTYQVYRIILRDRITHPDFISRGIGIPDSWKDSFHNFVLDVGPKPSASHHLTRMDRNKGYSKDNCEWRGVGAGFIPEWKTPEYRAWSAMLQRCYNENHLSYQRYGGRGIQVCSGWIRSFQNFFKDMGRRPGDEYSLERIDNDGNYEPRNCKWATKKEQGSNRENKIRLVVDGRYLSLDQVSDMTGIPYPTLYRRVRENRSIDQILSTPRKYTLADK